MPPPVGVKGKGKVVRENRRSSSRNTTPGSAGGGPTAQNVSSMSTMSTTPPTSVVGAGGAGAADMTLAQLITANLQHMYDDILERYGGMSGTIPDSRQLDSLAQDLRRAGQFADARVQMCRKRLRELAQEQQEQKAKVDDEQQQQQEQQEKDKEAQEERERERELEEKHEKLKKEAAAAAAKNEEQQGPKERKVKRAKRSRDGGVVPREERPLTHGAHGLARQDGLPSEARKGELK